MKIAFISPFFLRLARGIERVTVNLANQLADLGQEVAILTREGPENGMAQTLRPLVRVHAAPAFRYWESLWTVPWYAAQLRRGRYDVVNVFFAGYGEAEALRLAPPGAINFIVGYPFEQAPFQFHEFVRRGLAARLNGVIVQSRFMVPEIERVLGQPVQVIPNSVDLSYFDPAAVDAGPLRQSLNLVPGERVLLTVAALEERKGIQYVLNLLPRLRECGERVRYLVLGEGPDRPMLEARIRELGLERTAFLLGAQSDVRPYYKLADLVLLLSHGEGFPTVLLEALAMEKPVVVSPHPPYDEIVRPEFGVMVRETESEESAAVILQLLQDPARRSEMGRQARAQAAAHYSRSSIGKQFYELFEQQLNR